MNFPVRFNEGAIASVVAGLAITSVGMCTILYKERSPQAIIACISGLALSIFSKYEDGMSLGIGIMLGSVAALIKQENLYESICYLSGIALVVLGIMNLNNI